MQAGQNTYSQLAQLARRRMKKAEQGKQEEQEISPSESLTEAWVVDDTIGKPSIYKLQSWRFR
jgi:hypothetical protein